MGRELVPGRHWLIVLVCLIVAVLPPRLRDKLRGHLLDLTTRVTGGERKDDAGATAREASLAHEIALLQGERGRLLKALEDAGAAHEITTGSDDVRLIPAEAFPLAGPGDLIERVALDRGEKDGVRPLSPVVQGRALVGLTSQVTQGKCEVRLVTDRSFRMPATDLRTGADGFLSGTGGAELLYVVSPACQDDPSKMPAPGDLLVASRASSYCSLPAVIGVIRRVIPGDLPRADVLPAADLAHLECVVVLTMDDPLAKTRRTDALR